jgi:hypothetical protein
MYMCTCVFVCVYIIGREGSRHIYVYVYVCVCVCVYRECVLFIGTQFSNLYTAVDTPAKDNNRPRRVATPYVCLLR